jgi:Na+/H+ antiporter NhaD/arsenite permease-like protein
VPFTWTFRLWGPWLVTVTNTIGNAPNFMVRSIAEEAKIRVPSFFGYMLYSGAVLLPLFAVLTWVFFV